MNKKRIVLTIVVILVLAALTYLQFRTWRSFNWQVFFEQTRQANPLRIALAIVIISLTYCLRALPWHVMLRPVKKASCKRRLPPHFSGYTDLAPLLRTRESIRPH